MSELDDVQVVPTDEGLKAHVRPVKGCPGCIVPVTYGEHPGQPVGAAFPGGGDDLAAPPRLRCLNGPSFLVR
ncbi:hypothetical protein ACH4XT_31665 [Streptomyces avidinii]|uniref:hypothetical protein n=1 Tax=Streptomyces avidinii TaxID=1895 RepID=UPI003789C272